MAKTQAMPLSPITHHHTCNLSRKRDGIPWIQAATNFPPQHTTPNPGKWWYIDELHLVLHDCESCWLCKRWLHHSITEVAFRDGNLKRACYILNSASTTQKAIDNVQQKRDKASWDLANVHQELAYAQAIPREAWEDWDMAWRKVTSNDTVWFYKQLKRFLSGASSPNTTSRPVLIVLSLVVFPSRASYTLPCYSYLPSLPPTWQVGIALLYLCPCSSVLQFYYISTNMSTITDLNSTYFYPLSFFAMLMGRVTALYTKSNIPSIKYILF